MDILAPIDHATDPGRMKARDLEKMLYDLRGQPYWRVNADIEADFYDGNQYDSATLARLEERGIPPIITNLIAPTIDVVLGMEARTRRDWLVRAEQDKRADIDVADALTLKLHEAERLTRADRACSDAYAGQIKTGIHWVEVGRELNPFEYPYRVKAVNRREIWWDWRAQEPDLSDARYLIRRRWHDVDQVSLMFPKHKELIRHAMNNFESWDYLIQQRIDPLLVREFGISRDIDIDDLDWRDTERERVCLHEVWYKTMHRNMVLRLPTGLVMEFDKKNPRHVAVVQAGLVQPEMAVYPKIRLSWWIGPHRLADIPNPHPFNRFPYVAFFGKREDRTGVPYGFIRAMKPQQEEVNARRSRMMWGLLAKRVVTDFDAVHNKDHNAVMNEINRPDAYIKLDPNRMNKGADAFRVETDVGLNQQQYHIYNDAAQKIQDVQNIYGPIMGKNESQQSGVAIANLVEQGITTLGEVNDNYQFARMQVGEMLLALVKDDMRAQNDVAMMVGRNTPRQRKVVLNQLIEEGGERFRSNDVIMTRVRVMLDDTPSSPTYRQQQLRDLVELTRDIPPEMKAAIIPMVVEGTDLKNRLDIADAMRKASGQMIPMRDEADMTEEDKAELQAQAAAQQKAEEQEQLLMQEQANKVEKLRAEVDKIYAEIDKLRSDTVLNEHVQDEQAIKAQRDEDFQHMMTQLDTLDQFVAAKPVA